METVPGFEVSSNRLDEPGIELGTPGYKTSGLSTTPRLLLLFCVFILFVCLFDLILYVPSTIFQL